MRSYTNNEIIKKCEEESKDMRLFYKANIINYKGRTKEGELYTEVIAGWLLKNIEKFNKIEIVCRQKSYHVKSHDGKIKKDTNRKEEKLAKELLGMSFDSIGKVIDYQTPLKKSQQNTGLGKIDLLSVDYANEKVYLFELKKEDSTETMLRCVLEGYTYFKIVCKEKLYKDFDLPISYELKTAPLVFYGKQQYKEYMEEHHHKLHELMKKLNIIPFFLLKKDRGWDIIKNCY